MLPWLRRVATSCVLLVAMVVSERGLAQTPDASVQPKPPAAKPAPPKPTAAAKLPAASAAAKASAAPTSSSAAPPVPTSAASAEPPAEATFGPPMPPPEAPTAGAPAEQPATPTTSASPSPPAAPASGAGQPASSAPAPRGSAAPVRLNESVAFTLQVARGGQTAEQRASAATSVLRKAIDEGASTEVRVEQRGEVAVILLGSRQVVELAAEDAQAAGDASVQVHAARVANQLREAIKNEQSKNATLMTILSFALVIFSGMVALFLIRRAGEVADRARTWIAENPDRVPAIRLRSIEVIRPASLRAALTIGLGAGKALAQIGVAYGWLLLTLSLFEPTRSYAERLTGFVFGPLYALLARVVGSLPLLVVAAIATIAVVVLVRFVGLFFDSVARGETVLEWIPADLAAPTSLLVRAAVALTFFVIAAPLVTGDDDGALTRAGTVALVALGLATTPLLACGAVGVTVVYGRRLRLGDWAEVGGRSGIVRAVTLLEVRLEDESGVEVRVPHLLVLVHPTRLLGRRPLRSVELTLAASTAADARVREILAAAAATVGDAAAVDLLALDADGARWKVSANTDTPDARTRLYAAIAQALTDANIPLGRAPAPRPVAARTTAA